MQDIPTQQLCNESGLSLATLATLEAAGRLKLDRTEPVPHCRRKLVGDGTGVGRAPVDLFRAAGLKPPVLVPVTITGGTNVTHEKGYTGVPKRDVVSTAQVLLQQRRLTLLE